MALLLTAAVRELAVRVEAWNKLGGFEGEARRCVGICRWVVWEGQGGRVILTCADAL